MFNTIHPKKENIPGLKRLWAEAFGDTDEQIGVFFDTAFSPDRCMCTVENQQIIAAAYWLDCSYDGGKLAYLYAVATAQSHRGQGHCHRLLGQIHTLLAKRNYAGSILVPDEGLSSFYGAMGYTFFGGMETFSCQAGTPVPLKKINCTEYAALRRQFLPEGGVVQEKENLVYLNEISQFYTGEDVLLAATKEDKNLTCTELLGDHSLAPGVVATLECTLGQFRCPGRNQFAMFRSLNNGSAPGYFGFAFD